MPKKEKELSVKPDPIVQKSELKDEESKVKKVKRVKKKRRIGCVGFGIIAWLLLCFGIIFGVLVYPYVKEWITDNTTFYQDLSSDDTSGETRTIVTEENWVTDVVDQVETGVVSVAVAEASLNSDTGEIDSSVNIGTGFVIDSSGLIMTNQHVVSTLGEEYVIVSSDGEEFDVVEVSRDDVNDLAILKVDTDNLSALTLGDSDSLDVGQFVVAIGTPLGNYPGSVTTGIISGLGRSVTASSSFLGSSRRYENVIQTDAAINPGNSGGPLLDSEGNVIGINFATTSGADNISFAIPIDSVKERIAEYKEYGKFIKPFLGVEYQLISSTEALFYSDIRPGALVTSVIEDSPADEAGLERADIITEIEGEAVSSSFSAMIQQYEVGDTIELTVWRAGETLTLSATLEAAD